MEATKTGTYARLTRRGLLLGMGGAALAPMLNACTPAVTLPGPVARLYGRTGSFGGLASSSKLPTGESFAAAGVSGWQFGPGQSAYMSAVTADGSVVMATTPYTDNQMQPTGSDMELGIFSPAASRFQRLQVPSTRGYTKMLGPDGVTGGGDIGDVQVTTVNGAERVAFVSAVPFHGWRINDWGQLPTVAMLAQSSAGTWSVDPGRNWTADSLSTANSGSAATFPAALDAFGETYHHARGLCEMALLPRSQHLVITQYFGDETTQQGGVIVLDSAGKLRARFQYPAVTAGGVSVKVNVREVETDPSSAVDDERFVVVCDTFAPSGTTVPFAVQEFSYRASAGTITPVSNAVLASGDGARAETTKFGADGTLYVARTQPDGMTAAPLAVYRKTNGERRLVRSAPASAGWAGRWNTVVAPDQFVSGTGTTGLVRSLSVDPTTGAVLIAGASGHLQVVRAAIPGAPLLMTRDVDLGLNSLVDRWTRWIGFRKGSVDAARRLLWLPVPQLANLSTCPSGCPTTALDQWLYRIDLAQLLGK